MATVKIDAPEKLEFPDSYPTLQGCRALVAVGILSGHLLHGYGLALAPNQLTVDLFFYLEGFFAAQICELHKSTRQLIVLRIISLYPLYLVALLLGLISIVPLALNGRDGWTLQVLPETTLRGVFLLPSFLHVASQSIFPLNPPSWAIIAEAFIFVVFCLLRGRLGNRGFSFICVCAGLITLAMIFVTHDKNMGWQIHLFWGGYPRAIFGFFGGVLLYRLTQINYLTLPRLHPFLIWGAVVTCLTIWTPFFFFWLPALIVGLPLILLLGARSTGPDWLSTIGRSSGRHAHAFYLLSFPLQLILREVTRSIGVPDRSMGNLFGYFVALTIVSTVVHCVVRCIDEPLQRRTSSHVPAQ